MTAIDAPAKVTAGGQLDRARSTSRAAVPDHRCGITWIRTRLGEVTAARARMTTNPAVGSTRTRITPARAASTMRTRPSASATACTRTVDVDVEVATP